MFLIRKKRRKRKRKILTSDEVHELQTYIERSIAMVLSYPQKHQLFFWASSTLFLMSDITWAGSGAPNTELPATMQFAPAEAASAMVEGPKPPSTWKPNRKKYIHVHFHSRVFQKKHTIILNLTNLNLYMQVLGWVGEKKTTSSFTFSFLNLSTDFSQSYTSYSIPKSP